ncbi:hypothetical protein M1B35_29330 [Pseudomonas sp. MAFF 302046]|uniref:Uncharacterized protein n=1 Tax=Pseudomonas morbosilactucae TaxID=2938197 RepID=A0ABT0JQD9_9PSED|nr:hypothetical protein [Pseudomonas morbosilactucae]MCK9818120.1 hypothetical protein [Pseudomonas morbosilactucae]
MNRQSPPHRVATPQVASSTESPAAHPPIWHRGPDLLTVGSTGAAIFGFSFVVLWLLPGLVLTILLLLGFEAIPGEPSSDGSSLTTSSLIQFLCGSVVLMGLVFAWMSSAARVLAFTFDENQQLLTLTVTRRGRKPTEVQVPFSDIICISPYMLASYDRDGHFSVVCQGPRGKEFNYRLAEGTSLEDMEFHATWLRGIIGERMHELLNLDK